MNPTNCIDNLLKPRELAAAPIPLPPPLPVVEPFEPETLPADIRDFVMDVAQRQQCPPDFCAVAAIACLGALVGRKACLAPKQADDQWSEFPNMWAALIGGPSAMKSPSLREMRFPLNEIESALREEHGESVSEQKAEARLRKLEKAELEKAAKAHLKNGERGAAIEALKANEDSSDRQPTLARLVVNDATVEALGERLNENPNGLLLIRDELSGWLAKMNQEEYASDRAFYLESFNGKDDYTYDRIGRGTIRIENCMLSIVGGIQPAKIAPIVRGATKGATDDGLIQRFQLAVWPDPVKAWKWHDRPVNAEAKERYANVFRRLHAWKARSEKGAPEVWHFSPEGQSLFISWMEEIQGEARSSRLASVMESHLLKMPKTVSGLALLFAIINGERDFVSAEATAMALDWADYLRTHANRLYSASVGAEIQAAHIILRKRSEINSPFTARDVYRKCWSGVDSSITPEALEILVDHRYLFATDVSTGGRAKIIYNWWGNQNG
ncbi:MULTISPECIES: YfjI family protein [Marinobacter]|uniref:YfjI family protein n=2 Tax=Marinobacteraceae TaxID=2887365 RepID=UPI0029427123|nr:YfjI family protein [Marinobacter salarius]WOI18720.1 YfjI family protein [Marinobacter salarius]